MTVEKGQPWGRPGALPDDGVLVRSDAEASAAVAGALEFDHEPPVLGLVGGDLARTCGATGDVTRLRRPDAHTVHIDLGQVRCDGATHYFVAHLIARKSWWRGPVVAVMNAQYRGSWDVAPRSHPNDGYLDVLEGDLSLGDRWKARRRLVAGTHVPHPEIRQRRVRALERDLAPGTRLWLDGVEVGEVRHIDVELHADRLTAVV